MTSALDRFLHTDRLPHIWCSGCGAGMVTGAFLRAAAKLDLQKETTAIIGGIGCSSRAAGYLDFGTVHAIHGRALAFATGIKMARPDFTVIVFTGDGDGAAIGGNHLIHACRRNIDITCILFNNSIYGMTGGQASPMSQEDDVSVTAPYGQAERSFDLCRLTEAAGATYVARGTAYAGRELERLIRDGVRHKGFSFIEAVSQCPTEYGKRNPPKGAIAMLEDQRDRSVSVKEAMGMTSGELESKLITGLIYKDESAPEFQESYQRMLERVQQGSDGGN